MSEEKNSVAPTTNQTAESTFKNKTQTISQKEKTILLVLLFFAGLPGIVYLLYLLNKTLRNKIVFHKNTTTWCVLAGIAYALALIVNIKIIGDEKFHVVAVAGSISSVIGLIAVWLVYKRKSDGILLAVIQLPIGALILGLVLYNGLNGFGYFLFDVAAFIRDAILIYFIFCGIPALLLLITIIPGKWFAKRG